MGVEAYSTDPDLNTSINGIDIAEGCSPAGYNDALRQIMADIRSFFNTYVNVSYPIAIGSGGTGQTNAAAALAALGGLPSAYQLLPQVPVSGAFVLSAAGIGGHIYYTGAAAQGLVPANSFVTIPVGATFLIVNDGSGAIAINRDGGSVSMKWAQTGANANRSLAVGGIACLLKVAADAWFISGTGLS